MHTSDYTGQRAVIYARISKDKTGEALGVERQEYECRKYAESVGLEVVEVLKDNDISGYTGAHRPSFERLKRLIVDREIEAVIYWKQDRLTRSQSEFWQLVDIAKPQGRGDSGVGLHPATGGGRLDLTKAAGLLQAGFGALMAQHESAVRGERITSMQRQKAQANEWLGGVRPIGWNVVDKQLEVNEREAEAIRQAAEDILAGKAVRAVAREWKDPNRPGGPILSTHGNEISPLQVKSILRRTRNVGHNVIDLKDGLGPIVTMSPPIMSQELFERVTAFLGNPARKSVRTNRARHLLSGIAQCHCGAVMEVRHISSKGKGNSSGGYVQYTCTGPGRGHVSKRKEYVDTVVELFVFRVLIEDMQTHGDDPKVLERIEELRHNLIAVHERRDQAADAFAEGAIPIEQLGRLNQSLDQQVADIEAEIASLRAPQIEADLSEIDEVLRDYETNDEAFKTWRRMPLDDRRDWIRSRLHVVLRPHTKGTTRTFDTNTVSVYPRLPGEFGTTLSAEEVAERPLTPITTGGPPPSRNNLYANDDGSQVTGSWPDYLNMFANVSGMGWRSSAFDFGFEVMDSRADWVGSWKDPLEES